MKKAYNIKNKDLENILSLLKDNMHDLVVATDAIRLEEYIKRIKNGFRTSDTISLTEQLYDDLDYYEFYKPFYPVVERFVFTGKEVYELDSHVQYKSILFSDDQVMADVIDFYGHQGDLFYSQVLEFYQEAQDHLKFVKDTVDTDGETLFLKSIGEAFVFSPNYSNITKFTILIHEIQHVIDFYINQDFSDQYIIRETIAMFMELIATDYVAKKYNLGDEGFKRQRYLYAIVKFQSYNIMNKMDILEIASNNKNVSKEDLISILDKEGFDQNDLDFYFEQSISTDYSYQLAYLIAIELYTIYYKDKELALVICEDIILNGNSDNIYEILNKYNIKPNDNVVNYENLLFKKR